MKALKEKVIAVVGVSGDSVKFGYRIFQSLVQAGYSVYGINPKGGRVLNREIFRNLSEVKPVPDLVITAVKPDVTENIVEQCAALGIKEIWMQPGSESQKAVERAKELGMNVTHNACIMTDSGIW